MTIDNTPTKIRAVLDKPGVYFAQTRGVFLIEIDDKQQVHQLRPHSFKRDGILDAEGWVEPDPQYPLRLFLLTEV